jgi:prepilin-type N-terminal cleavage/methylation domain-containing protein
MKSSISSENKKLGLPAQAGFTLLELIVVMTISTIIMTTLVIQQSKWNDSLIVSTQAYEMALMIRQAQIYSLGVREDTAGSGDKFNIGYGVYFDNDATRYIYFADRDGDKKYGSGEEVETKIFTRGVTIKDICGNTKCMGGSFQQANIVFLRPDPKANILLCNAGGVKQDDPPVTIRLQSPGGKFASVKVEANGQVSIQ